MSSDFSRSKMNVPLPYGFSEIDKLIYGKAKGVQKYFEDPDYIYLDLGRDFKEGQYGLKWATPLDALEASHALRDFINQGRFTRGRVGLIGTDNDNTYILGCPTRVFKGTAEDILDELQENSDRATFFEVSNRVMHLAWAPSFGVDFHDIPTNMIQLHTRKTHAVGRFSVDQCVALTGYPGLKANLDVTLDQFSQYVDDLKREDGV
jgi:hypothetical protein